MNHRRFVLAFFASAAVALFPSRPASACSLEDVMASGPLADLVGRYQTDGYQTAETDWRQYCYFAVPTPPFQDADVSVVLTKTASRSRRATSGAKIVVTAEAWVLDANGTCEVRIVATPTANDR